MSENSKYKISFLISHPTQYHAPLFRELAKNPKIELTVYFCARIGLGEQYDKTYKRILKWDTPILEGYEHIFLKSPLQIFSELKKNKYDAIIVHGYNLPAHWLAFFAAWFTKTPLILKGEADIGKKSTFPKNAIKKIILTSLFKKADAFLYSYNLNKEFFRIYGAPEEKLFFCPSAVDNEFFQRKAKEFQGKKNEIKTELGVKNLNWPVVLFVGQFAHRKRLNDLLNAAKMLVGKLNFNLLLVGEGKEKEKLENFVKEDNLENVYFLGFKNQSELPKIYSAADVFALPSEYDPSPKAMQEALNFGLPIVASDGVKTATDLILGGDCGLIYKTGDIKQLTENLRQVMTNNSLREKLGKNALNIVSKRSLGEDVKGIIKAIQYVKSKS